MLTVPAFAVFMSSSSHSDSAAFPLLLSGALPPAVLCFGASDPTSAGGLQADALTLASMGCHPLAVLCAVLVRDTRRVEEWFAIDDDAVVSQARAVLEDVPVRAFRIGMAGSVENLVAIAEILSDYPEVPLVVEPGLRQFGDDADDAADDYAQALCELVLPQATLVVTDRHELSRLGEGGEDDGGGGDAAGLLAATGAEYVLVTDVGGHGAQVVNVLHGADGVVRTDAWERLAGQYLGARATLASAVCAGLGRGMSVDEAVREAQAFTWQSLTDAFRPGMGQALPDRLFWARR